MSLKIILAIFFLLLSFTTTSYAKTSDEYLEDVYKLIDQKQYDEALTLVQKSEQEYPGDLGLTMAGSEIYHLKGDYETAIANYLNIMNAIISSGKEAPEMIHQHLADAYNKLGQKHYFPQELSLRIIYHTEKLLELNPKSSQDSSFIEFLRKSIGHYDTAGLGKGNVQMMETGGDGAEFKLPEDNISVDEKKRYKDKAVQRIKEYDGALKEKAFQTGNSDKTIDDIIQLVKQRTSAINSIHFKRMNTAGGTKTLLEEIFYKSPDKLKVIAPDATSIINDKDYYVLDPQTNKVANQDHLDSSKLSLLRGIGFYNLQESMEAYNLTIEKIIECPDFLSEACKDGSMNLYLITGKLKDKDKGPHPPTPKVEYFIDGQTGLCLAKREYWLGVLGSGKEEELAKETRITQIEQRPEGMSLASAGLIRGYVQELANLKQDWIIDVESINQEINEQQFSVK